MSDTTPPSGSAPTGSSVNPVYTKRNMTLYALTESEISTISALNAQVSMYFSISSFLLSACLSVYTNAVFYDTLNAAGALAKGYVAPLIGLLGAAFLIMGLIGVRRRASLVKQLKNDSAIQG